MFKAEKKTVSDEHPIKATGKGSKELTKLLAG